MTTQKRSNLIAARNALSELFRQAGPGERQDAIGEQIDVLDAKLNDEPTTMNIKSTTDKFGHWLILLPSDTEYTSCGEDERPADEGDRLMASRGYTRYNYNDYCAETDEPSVTN